MRPLPLLLLTALLTTIAPAALAMPPGLDQIDQARLRADVDFLASEELEGRFTGTPGCEQAAGYIAAQLGAAGISPGAKGGSWYDEFTFTSGVSLAAGNACTVITGTGLRSGLSPGMDFVPLFFSPNGSFEAEAVFAGYGITAPEYGWDDYKDLDVRSRVVLVLRHEPGMDDPDSPFEGKKLTRYSDLRQKAIRARERGAAAMIVITGPRSPAGEADELLGMTQVDGFGEVGIPVMQMKRRHADALLASVGMTIEAVQAAMDTDYAPVALHLPGSQISGTIALERISTQSANVVGWLEGSDPELRAEIIVIGAHYDHLGWGQSGSLHTGPPAIHYGADDNASGVAGVIELARSLARDPQRTRRSVCFVLFSGEELGLLGSSHFVKEPPFALEQVKAMLNMDMIGRLNAEGRLLVQGTGTAPHWPDLIRLCAQGLPLEPILTEDGVGPSDQTAFVARRIPVLSFFSGVHDDYHRPTDTADKINFAGQVAILTLIRRILDPLVAGEVTPVYTEVAGGADPMRGVDTNRGFNIYLGTIPDYAITDRLVLQGVREGAPGWEAGLRPGDQLLRFGDIAIGNVYDYTYALQTYQPGDVVELQVRRGEEEFTITLTLVGRGQSGLPPGGHGEGHGQGESGSTGDAPAHHHGADCCTPRWVT